MLYRYSRCTLILLSLLLQWHNLRPISMTCPINGSNNWIPSLQVEQGADLLDINMDDGLIEGVGAMTRFVNLLVADPETSRVPFMIDSSKVRTL